MAILKRVFFFALVNILVLTTITITLNILSAFFGIQIDPNSFTGLILFCAVFGMGGAFISLFISKWMAKKMMGVQIIDPQTNDPNARRIVEMVHNMSRAAKLPKMPEVGVYNSPEVNAFATGPSRSNSLVAVSTGLLQKMNQDQVEGVIGHEVAHIANGDMVTMTLIQGIVNTFVMVFARLLANVLTSQMDERARGGAQFALIIVLQIALSILGSIVVNFFSRWREYRADIGGAKYAGRDKMISALQALSGNLDRVDHSHESFASLKISSGPASMMAKLFSTHPPLSDRIARLERARIS